MIDQPRPAPEAAALYDPAYLARIRGEMLKFARLQLGHDGEAEDAVQEALAGALRNAASFRSTTALKTWLIAILKHKISDILRQRRRRPIVAADLVTDDEDGTLPALFDRRGMWNDAARPASWEDPEASITTRQFLAVFDACINKLPAQQARVFLMREVVELGTEEICHELALSATNLRVILHRARLSLRACLEQNWLQP